MTGNDGNLVEVRNLTFRFGSRIIFDDIDVDKLSVREAVTVVLDMKMKQENQRYER